MLKSGAKVKMTKGYKDILGTIVESLESQYEFYIIQLDTGIHIIAGPSAFIIE